METNTSKKLPIHRLPLFALFVANAVSMTGSVLTLIAVPWFVLQTTGSASKTGLTAFFEVLAVIIAGFFGGTIVDHLGYKRTSILADLASGIAIALVPLLYYTIGLAFWQLLALVFFSAFFDAPGTTARTALLPDVAALAGMPLERANAILQAIQRGSRLLGAPIAGALIALLGTSRVLWIDAASFWFSAVMVILAIPRSSKKAKEEKAGRYFAELLEGLRFIRRDRLVFSIVLTIMITNFLDSPLLSVILPVYARERFGSALDLGLAFAAFGGGSLIGAIIFGMIGPRMPRRATFIGSFIAVGLPFWLLATLPSLPLTVAILAFVGLASGPINPILGTIGQERVPANMRGRVFGTITAGAYAAIPLGVLLAGYLLDLIGIRITLFALATCYLVVTLSLLFNPSLREMDVHVEIEDKPGLELIGDTRDTPIDRS